MAPLWSLNILGSFPPGFEHLGCQRFHYLIKQLVLLLGSPDVRMFFLKWSLTLFTFNFPPVLSSYLGPLEPLQPVISLPIRPFASLTHLIS